MDEAHKDVLRLDSDRRLKLESHGTKVTGDGGHVRNLAEDEEDVPSAAR